MAEAEAISPDRMSAGGAPGARCFMRAATAAALGAADEVPKKLGRLRDRCDGVDGWPGNGALLVSIGEPSKNEVLPPSGAVIAGFWIVWAVVNNDPSGLRTMIDGPDELKGSERTGVWPR